jgi:uncharacterized damage-inducible protein DinB
MNDDNQLMRDIISLHRVSHEQLREAISGLDSAALNWRPGPDTSSIGTIVVHVLGAEAEMLRNLLLIPTQRNRDAEFAVQEHQLDSLMQLIDSAEADWEQLVPRLRDGDLYTSLSRPNKPVPQTGLFWLVRNYGHLREHLAQVQLTRQLYLMRNE